MGILNSVTIGGSGSATIKIANVATSTSSGNVTFSVENDPTWWAMCADTMSTSAPPSGSYYFVEGSSDAPCGYRNRGYAISPDALSPDRNRPSKSYNASTHTVTFTQYSSYYRIPAYTKYILFYI